MVVKILTTKLVLVADYQRELAQIIRTILSDSNQLLDKDRCLGNADLPSRKIAYNTGIGGYTGMRGLFF